jgi:hypothetical protein
MGSRESQGAEALHFAIYSPDIIGNGQLLVFAIKNILHSVFFSLSKTTRTNYT